MLSAVISGSRVKHLVSIVLVLALMSACVLYTVCVAREEVYNHFYTPRKDPDSETSVVKPAAGKSRNSGDVMTQRSERLKSIEISFEFKNKHLAIIESSIEK